MAGWASRVITELGHKKDKERRAFDGLDPKLLSNIGLGRMTFSKAKEGMQEVGLVDPSRKMNALQELDLEPKRMALVESEEINENGIDCGPVWVSDYNKVEVEAQSKMLSQIVILEEVSLGNAATRTVRGGDSRDQGRS